MTQIEAAALEKPTETPAVVEKTPVEVADAPKPVLKPAPIPQTTPWNTITKTNTSINFESIIRKKPEPVKDQQSNRRSKRKNLNTTTTTSNNTTTNAINRKKSSEKRSNSKDDQNDAAGKRTRSKTQQQQTKQQQQRKPSSRNNQPTSTTPYYINIQDIEIGTEVNWPSEEAKSQSIDACAQQLEYYLGINNLLKDMYLRKHMNSEGWIKLNDISQFTRVKAITGGDISVITAAVKQASGIESNVESAESFDAIKLRTLTKPLNWVLPEDQRLNAASNGSSKEQEAQ